MKNWVRYTIGASFLALMCAGTGLAVHAQKKAEREITCNSTEIIINGEAGLISEDFIKARISKHYRSLTGERTDSVDLSGIERLLSKEKAIKSCQAWITRDGILHVSVEQRKPVVRFQDGDRGCYMDAEGCTFPTGAEVQESVPVIYGKFHDDEIWNGKVLKLVATLKKGGYLDGRIGSMKVDDSGELSLISGQGKETFIFGQPEDIQSKLGRMDRYYKSIVPALEEGKSYRSVNLKYKGQIICK